MFSKISLAPLISPEKGKRYTKYVSALLDQGFVEWGVEGGGDSLKLPSFCTPFIHHPEFRMIGTS